MSHVKKYRTSNQKSPGPGLHDITIVSFVL